MTEHELKTWPDYWLSVESGAKPFEVRRNDRGFQPGDVLRLREWNPESEEYTGREVWRRVTYVLRDAERFGLQDGFVVLGIVEHPAPVHAPDPSAVLACPMDDNDAGADTIRTYLVALLEQLWKWGEEFGGKRPFGNSGWEYELYTPLAKAGFISGTFDSDGYVDEMDSDAGRALITAAIKHLYTEVSS